MNTTYRRLTAIVMLALLGAAGPPLLAQTPDPASDEARVEQGSAAVPDPRRLTAKWWDYFAPGGKFDAARAQAAIAKLNELVAQAGEPSAAAALPRLRSNIEALAAATSAAAPEPEPVPAPARRYTLPEFMALEARRYELAESLALERGEADRLAAASRSQRKRVDGRFTTYLALGGDDARRLAEGIGVMADRTALAAARIRAERAAATVETLKESLKAIQNVLTDARERLTASPESLASLTAEIETATARLAAAANGVREAEDKLGRAATGNADEERAAAQLRAQQVVAATVGNAGAQADLFRLDAQKDWTALRSGNDKSISDDLRDASIVRQDYLAEAADRYRQWRTATERELLNMGELSSQDGLLADLTRQRLAVAQETLVELERLRRSTAELKLISDLVDAEITARSGFIERGVSTGFGAARRWLGQAGDWLSATLFHIGETPVTTLGVLRFLLIVVIALWLSRLVRAGLARFARTRAAENQSAFYTIGRLAHYAIIVIGLFVALSSIGLNLGNLALVAGALSVGIGFGLQSIVNNFVSGLIILFERSIKVGDFIELDAGLCGTVREINVRSTLINTNDNIDIVVPNSEFVSARLTNWTLREADRRMHIPFGVSYASDKDLVRKVVLEAAGRVPHTLATLSHKVPQVWLINFGDSSLDFELVVWLGSDSARSPSAVHAAYIWEIETALKDAGIEIPFPQRDLHLRSGFEGAGQSGDGTVPGAA